MKKYTFLLGQFLLLLATHLAYAQMGIAVMGEGGGSPKPLWLNILVIVLMVVFFVVASVLLRRRFQHLSESLLQRIDSEGIILQEKDVKIKVSYKAFLMLSLGVFWTESNVYLTPQGLYIIPLRRGEFLFILAKQVIPGVGRLIRQYLIEEVKVVEEELVIKAVYLREKSLWKIKVSDPHLWEEKILENL